jgi:ATP/maltotriose-dependent transcriptional regulator MalT
VIRTLALRGPERETDWCTYLASLWDWLSFFAPSTRTPPALAALAAGEELTAYRVYLQNVSELRAAGALGELLSALCELCSVEIVLGRWRDASTTGGEAMRLALDSGQRLITRAVQVRLARIASYRGRADECRALAAASMEATGGPDHSAARALALWPLGVLELGSGRWEAAFANLAAMSESGSWASAWYAVVAAGDYVEAAIRTGHLEEAAQVVGELRTWGMPNPPGWLLHVLGRCEAQLATGRAAEDAYLAALAVPDAGRRPFELARTQLAYGQWLRRERRRADARLQLRAAVEAFDRLGAAQWSDQARRELRATGETMPRRDHAAIDRLTPQELQISRLAAKGLSNKEIGSRLFMSPRTVESHLYKVFPKLGIGSRADLRGLQLEDAAAIV